MKVLDRMCHELAYETKEVTHRESVAIDEAHRIMETANDSEQSAESRLAQIHDRAQIICEKLSRSKHRNHSDKINNMGEG